MSFVNKINQIKEELDTDVTIKLGGTKYFIKKLGSVYQVGGIGTNGWTTTDYKKAVGYFIKLVQRGMVEGKEKLYKAMQEYNAELDECNNKLAELHSKIKRG